MVPDEKSPRDNNLPDNETLLCFCYGVPRKEIIKAIEAGARTRADIQAKTQASTGCGGCANDVEELIKETLERLNKK